MLQFCHSLIAFVSFTIVPSDVLSSQAEILFFDRTLAIISNEHSCYSIFQSSRAFSFAKLVPGDQFKVVAPWYFFVTCFAFRVTSHTPLAQTEAVIKAIVGCSRLLSHTFASSRHVYRLATPFSNGTPFFLRWLGTYARSRLQRLYISISFLLQKSPGLC